ncbi:hypothetical protein EW026_g8036 [Hermanssonia centrifuga]|uniref:Fungal-type protein kinase domain-containing protein n=1 Tax=Hermanssonia centrifuga TaxID=98765 RepID=A0A4S4K5U6_9APHY|nr:hypothetical protein EW026_g8036 [Hermanssonia centrifuga]
MEARYNEGLFYYDITVRSSDGEKFVYRTLDKISESGAAMILGRGTRVWKAIETKSGEPHGEPVVLKESWVDTDRMREGAVHQAIRDTNYSELDRWLLTVQCHGDVFIGGNTENEQVDLTLAIIKHSYTRQSRYGTRSAAVLEHEMVYNPQPHPRVHYRIVFKEVCKPMRGLSLEGIYLALGEIYANGNARLTDLEYAKKLNDDSVREEYIGTANFIAAEVADQCYHYRLHVASDRSYSTEMDSDDLYTMVLNFRKPGGAEQYKDKLSSRLSRVRPKKVEAPFRYNPLHDLESLWWVAVYHLFKREVVSIPGEIIIGENELARREEQRICAGELFCNKNWSLFTNVFNR